MTDHCIVIPGDWTSAGSLWEFVIDKKKMSRIVPVRAGMSLCELQSNVVQEFFTFTVPAPQAVLSYWSPNMKELATGLTTPPVVLINDGAVSFFFQHLAVHKTMNLFDTFNSEGVNQQDTQVGDNVYPFTTPNQTPYPNLNPFRPSSSSSFKIPSFSLFDEDELLQDSPLEPSNVNTSPHHIHQANPHRVSVQDETLSCGDEMLEEMFKEDPDNIPDTWLLDEEDATEPENSQPPDPIPERGYDKDFWEPLIKEHLGGSHAAEVMAGIHVPKTAPETYQSYTGNAFDHPVRVSGVDDTDWKKDLDFMSVHQREGPPVQCKTPNTRVRRADPNTLGPDVHTQSPYTDTSSDSPYTPLYGVHSGLTSTHTRNNLLSPRTPRSTHGRPREPTVQTPPPRETRPLSDISDKEFDIPPLFDDLSFENDDVPDLNLEDTDGEPHVGKLYATKQDCQIGLAIYAIKKRFHLRQTRTTTLEKAQLDHTCPLDQRDQYKTKATSKVIAHIYRSRYGEPNEGPKAPQLQQLVLEDLRVSASYMKCHRAKGQAVDTAVGNTEDHTST
ncbi:hypothetical protein YC2023_094385 [Brassica napus]